MYYYAASTNGFYHTDVNLDIPIDAVPMNLEEYNALLGAQARGKRIVAGPEGLPTAIDPPPPPPPTPASLAAVARQEGLQIASKSVVERNGKYAVTISHVARVSSVASYITMFKSLPATTTPEGFGFARIDADPFYTKDPKEFMTLAAALLAYSSSLDSIELGVGDVLPEPSATVD